MPATFELTDGSTTIDLLRSPYFASRPLSLTPPTALPAIATRYTPRSVEATLDMRASNAGEMRDAIRALERVCAIAERRAALGYGEPVSLLVQLGDASGDDVGYRVLWGELALPPDLLRAPALSTARAAPGATLRLLVEPFGRLPPVSSAAAVIHNEQDGANVNYIDISGVGGAREAKFQMKIADANGGWDGAARMWIARRSGARRLDALFFQGESGSTTEGDAPFDAGSPTWSGDNAADGDASGGSVARMRWHTRVRGQYATAAEFTRAGRVRLTAPGGALPAGIFRALARVRIAGTPFARVYSPDRYPTESAMAFALGWQFGDMRHTPASGEERYLEETSRFQTLDLGELTIAPMALPSVSGGWAAEYSHPDFHIDIYGVFHAQPSFRDSVYSYSYHAQWDVDSVTLLPIDEGAVILDDVSPADRPLIDTLSDSPGVYLLDAQDVVKRFADFTGGSFGIGPEDTRIYILRDDPGDPSAVQFSVSAKHAPVVAGV